MTLDSKSCNCLAAKFMFSFLLAAQGLSIGFSTLLIYACDCWSFLLII